MFASSGYFKGLNCPYFASGLCERSYCHFRHVKQDENEKRSKEGSIATVASQKPATALNSENDKTNNGVQHQPSLLSMVGNAIMQVQRDIEKDKAQINHLKKSVSAVPLYNPTPIVKKSASLSSTQTQHTAPKKSYIPDGVPAYKPTPIAVLKKQQHAEDTVSKAPSTSHSFLTSGNRITLGDAGKVSGQKRQTDQPISSTGKKSKPDTTDDEIEAKFSEEEDEQLTQSNVEKEAEHRNESVSSKKSEGTPKTDNKNETEEQSPNKETDQSAVSVQEKDVKRDKEKGNDVGEKQVPGEGNAKPLSADDKEAVQATEESHSKTLESKHDNHDKLSKAESTNNVKEHEKEKKVKKHSDRKRDKENHVKDKHKHKHKSSRKERHSRESQSSHHREKHKDSKSSRSKHSSDSSKHKSRSSSSSHHRNSSSKRSQSKKRHSSSHKRKKDRDKKSSQDKKSKHHERESRRHSEHHSNKKKKRHRSRSRSLSSDYRTSKKRRHSTSSESSLSDSLSESGDSSSSSFEISSLSTTPSGSRASSPHNSNANNTAELLASVVKLESDDKTVHQDDNREKGNKYQNGLIHRSDSLSSKEQSSARCEDSSSQDVNKIQNSDKVLPHHERLSIKQENIKQENNKDEFKQDDMKSNSVSHSGTYKSAAAHNGVKVDIKSESHHRKDKPADILSKERRHSRERKHSRSSSSGHCTKKTSQSTSENKHDKRKISESSSGANVFEKFQRSISRVELFGDDSDGTDDLKLQKSCGSLKDDVVIVLTDDDDLIHDEGLELLDSASNNVVKKEEPKQEQVSEAVDEDSYISAPKKRIAHTANPDAMVNRGPKHRPISRPSPAQVMLNRFKQVQESGTSANTEPSSGKQRIAHTPSSSAARPGQTLLKKKQGQSSLPNKHTPAATVGKDGKRIAHVPSTTVLKRPILKVECGGKVATNVRQRYLNLFIDECVKLYPERKDAYDRALAEEKSVNDRAPNKNIYLNVAVNTIKKLRDEVSRPSSQDNGVLLSPSKNPKVVSHAAMLGGAKAATTGFTLNRSGGSKKLRDKFTEGELYSFLSKYILTEKELEENGFPRASENQGEAKLKIPDRNKHMSKDVNEKGCCRCGAKFVVFPEGQYARQEACSYHWGKSFKRRIAGSIENRYTCCGGDLETKGCQISKYHVHEQNKFQNLKKYKETKSSSDDSKNCGVYALDCEMVYTSTGVELARVTVINFDLKVVYESLVRPECPVLDYNTRFSGITAEDMEGVTTTIHDVQNSLLKMFSDKTILIGHSLESDMIALKMIHNTVVDTSVVFPHRLGPPFKRALKTLMAEILQKIIQNDDGGHDSKEDAVSCMELMIWKVKQDSRKLERSGQCFGK